MIVRAAGVSFAVDAVVFDKDGTLIDLDTSWFSVTEAWIGAVGDGDQRRINDLRAALGVDPGGFLVPGGIAATGTFQEIEYVTRRTIDDDLAGVEMVLGEARAIMSAAIMDLPISPIGDVRGTMVRLAAAGLVLCVASSDDEATIRKHLGKLEISDNIVALIGGDGPAAPKPDPAALRYLSSVVGVPVDRMLMVGDSFTDLGVARNAGAAGMVAIADQRGTTTLEEIADAVIGSIEELVVVGP